MGSKVVRQRPRDGADEVWCIGAGVADRLARGASTALAAADLISLCGLLHAAKCFTFVRQQRCPGCSSDAVVRDGYDDTQPDRQRYRCKTCASRSDNLTGTVLAGHHQPLRVWGFYQNSRQPV